MSELERPAGTVRIVWRPDPARLERDAAYARAVQRFVWSRVLFGVVSTAYIAEDEEGRRVLMAWSIVDRDVLVEPIEEGTPLP